MGPDHLHALTDGRGGPGEIHDQIGSNSPRFVHHEFHGIGLLDVDGVVDTEIPGHFQSGFFVLFDSCDKDASGPFSLGHLKPHQAQRPTPENDDKILWLNLRSFENAMNRDGHGLYKGRLFVGDSLRNPVEEPRRDGHILGKPAVDSPAQSPFGGADMLFAGKAEPTTPTHRPVDFRDDPISHGPPFDALADLNDLP